MRNARAHPQPRTRARWARLVLAVAAVVASLLVPQSARAAMSIVAGPKVAVNPSQVTIWWHSSSTGSSELRWDTSNKGDFASFANDASNTATDLGTLHSRTISNLPAGTYSFRVRTTGAAGQATSGARSFTVTAPNASTPLGSTAIDGTVYALEATSTRVYVGGQFSRMGTRVGSGVRIDPATASASAGAGAPHIAGWTEAAIDAPDGSRYVGGRFTHVGGLARSKIARLLPDGGVDPYFVPGTGFNGNVLSLALSGSTLYAGGDFTSYGGTTRMRIAALDAITGAVDTTFAPPGTGFNGTVSALRVNGTRIYAGGSFTTYGGTSRPRIAALDRTTAALDSGFAPGTGFDSSVRSIDIAGGRLYAAGYFTTYRGAARRGLVALDPLTATQDAGFDPGTGHNANGISKIIAGPSRLYVGGSFWSFNGTSRNGLLAVDLATGAVDTTFNATNQLNSNGWVYGMALAGSKLYVAGRFDTYGGTPRASIAAVDATTGALDATFNPGTGFGSGGDVAVLSHNPLTGSLFAGGWFATYQASIREGLGAIDTTTGTVDASFNPGSSLWMVEDLLLNGSTLYVGGQFTSYQGYARSNILAVNATTAAINTTFNPGSGASSAVRALALNGTKLYLGGAFTSYNGSTRNHVAAVSATTAALDTTFNPGTGFDNYVEALAISGSRLYAGGWFSTYAGTSRVRIAALDTTTAALDTGFTPGTGFSSYVFSLVTSGSTLYAGGAFTTYDGASHGRIAALDVATADPVAGFSAGSGFNGTVYDLALSASGLVAAGNFSAYGGAARTDLAVIDPTSGTLVTAVDPGSLPSDNAFNAVATNGALVAGGGFFGNSNGVSSSGVVMLSLGNPADSGTLSITTQPQHDVTPHQATVWWETSSSSSSELVWDRVTRSSWSEYQHDVSNAGTNLGTVHSRTISHLPQGTYYYRVRSRTAGGEQVTSAEYSFRVDPPDAATPLGTYVTDDVRVVREYGSRIYLAGDFTQVGIRRGGGIQVNSTTAATTDPGAPQVAGAVQTSVPDGAGGYYIGGSFTRVGGLERDNIAHILPDGGVDPTFDSSDGFSSGVVALLLDGGRLYVGGNFTSYGGVSRPRIAALDATTAALDTTFDPGTGFSSSVTALKKSGSLLYVGGYFTTYQGTSRPRIAALDATTAALDATFNPGTGFNASVVDLELNGSLLYVAGYFTSYQGTGRNYILALNATTAALDGTFNPGTGFSQATFALSRVGTKLYVGGYFTAYQGTSRTYIAALNATTAALDTTFLPGTGFDAFVQDLVVDGTRVIAVGAFTTYKGTSRPGITALDATTAALDTTFLPGTGFSGQVETISISGSRAFVGGYFSSYRGAARNRIAALDARTFLLDEGFDPGTGFNTGWVEDLAFSGNTVYVSGTYTSYQGTSRPRIAALNATTAALDTTFNPGTGFNASTTALHLEGSRLYVGGGFATYQGVSRNKVAVLNATTAALDTTFLPGTGFNGSVNAFEFDGTKLYAAGWFTSYQGTTRNNVAVLNATTAALDTTFDPGTGFDQGVWDLELDAGKLYAGGHFYTYQGVTRSYVAAIDATTAALDTTFDPDTGFDSWVSALAIDGTSLYVGGAFWSYQGTDSRGMAILDTTTAALDQAYWSDSGGYVDSISITGSNLVVGGDMRAANHVAGGLAVLSGCDRSGFCSDEVLRDYVTVSLSATNLALPSAMPGLSSTATLDVAIQSNAFNGYTILATDTSDTDALTCTVGGCAGRSIPDWSGLPGAPTTWSDVGSDYGFGVSVLSSTLEPKDTTTWGTGATATDFTNNRYVGLRSSTPTTLHRLSRFRDTTVDTTRIALRSRAEPTQYAGTYGGTIAITAIANP